jgi:tRNA 2-thiouridine synthesizing protein A
VRVGPIFVYTLPREPGADAEVYGMADIKVDVRGETCPVPLVETRKALRKASPGDTVEIIGTHPASKKEIPMALKALGLKPVEIQEEGDVWTIRIGV